MPHKIKTMAERFWPKVRKSEGCWEWTGHLNFYGYGVVCKDNYRETKKRQHVGAHRVSYELNVGEIPDGLHVLHSCDNTRCVRPDHLFVGTQADNNRDKCEKGRHRWNESVIANNKLTPEQARFIRRLYAEGLKQEVIAGLFKMNRSHINDILRGKIWATAGGPIMPKKTYKTRLVATVRRQPKIRKYLRNDEVVG